MKNSLKKALLVVLLITLCIPNIKLKAATENYITLEDYITLLVKATGSKVDSSKKNPYIEVALEKGIVKKGEYSSYKTKIKKEDAALLANRTDELLHGKDYDQDLYKQVQKKKRIYDLSKVTKSKQDAVKKVFVKGIMVGKSNGIYKSDRKINGKSNLTLSSAKIIISRVKNPLKRKKLSPDGQVIRTTKLPKNYKSYKYILESYPNAFYEKKFIYQLGKYSYKPVELVDYAAPAKLTKKKFNGYDMQEVLDANLDTWTKKIETNLKTRLNVDYRTINSSWINKLRKTYFIYDDADMDKRRTDDIKEYVTKMKKNKVIVTGTVTVEPSSLYYALGYYMRACIKFKVTSATNLNNGENVLYGDTVYIKNLKKDTWYTMYVDIGLGSAIGNTAGEYEAVYRDSIY